MVMAEFGGKAPWTRKAVLPLPLEDRLETVKVTDGEPSGHHVPASMMSIAPFMAHEVSETVRLDAVLGIVPMLMLNVLPEKVTPEYEIAVHAEPTYAGELIVVDVAEHGIDWPTVTDVQVHIKRTTIQ
jgi:hypothetical protein